MNNNSRYIRLLLASFLIFSCAYGFQFNIVGLAVEPSSGVPKVIRIRNTSGLFDYATLTYAYYSGGKYLLEREYYWDGDTYYNGFKYNFQAKNQTTSNIDITLDFEKETFTGIFTGTIISPNVTWGDYYDAGYDHMGYVTPPNGLYAYENSGEYLGTFSGILEPLNWNKPGETPHYKFNTSVDITLSYTAYLTGHKKTSGVSGYYPISTQKMVTGTGVLQGQFYWKEKDSSSNGGSFNIWYHDYANGPSASFSSSASGDVFDTLFEVVEYYPRNIPQLGVNGPTTISDEDKEIKFLLESEGNLDNLKYIQWIFSYQKEIGEWVNLDPIKEAYSSEYSGITIPDLGDNGKNKWVELAKSDGVKNGDKKKLSMKAKVFGLNEKDEPIAESNSYEYYVETESKFEFQVSDTLELYPMSAKNTELRLFYKGINPQVPIELKVEGIPQHIKTGFNISKITPSASGSSGVEFTVFHDPEKNPSTSYPQEVTIKITMTSGVRKYSKNIKIKLLPIKWLIINFIAAESDNSLQEDTIDDFKDIERAYNSYFTDYILDSNTNNPVVVSLLFDSNKDQGEFKKGQALWLLTVNNSMNLIGNLGNKNMGDITVYNDFIQKSIKKIPYENSMLVLSGHGSGLTGLMEELNPEDILTLTELSGISTRFDIIALDSCFMGQTEVINNIKNMADYLVASELIISTDGYNYEAFLEYLFENPSISPKDLAGKIVDTYFYESLAVIESGKISSLVQTVDALSKALVNGYTSGGKEYEDAVKNAVKSTSWIGSAMSYFDIVDFCNELVKNVKDETVKTAANNVIKDINDVIVKLKINRNSENFPTGTSTLTEFNGLSIFFWKDSLTGDSGKMFTEYEEHYKATSFSSETSWLQFIKKFIQTRTSKSTTIKLSGDNKLNLHVTDKQGKHVGFNSDLPRKVSVEGGIPGALYLELDAGDEIILLPETVSEFNVIIDGNVTAETVYTVSYTIISDDEITSEETTSGIFEQNSKHTIPVTLEEDTIILSDVEIETTNEPEPEAPGGIPGFPRESLILSILLASVIMWVMKKKN